MILTVTESGIYKE